MAPHRIAPKNRIRRFRVVEGLTVEQLAKDVGVSKATVSRWERGEQAVPQDAWFALSDRFGGVQLDYLMGRGE